MLIILGNSVTLLMERIKNIFLYTTNQFDWLSNKMYNMCLDGATYFSKEYKNHLSDDT